MNTKLHDENVDFLFDAILTLKNREECYKFFEDLCTSDIVDKTGASTATISRVNRSLNYGSDGYTLIFERLLTGGGKED